MDRSNASRREWSLAFGVFLVGWGVRLAASATLPLLEDEHYWITIARAISFDPEALDLEGPGTNDHPLLGAYMMKASVLLFGDTVAGWRVVFTTFSSFGLLATYGFARLMVGHRAALCAMILLAVNQFHVGFSRIMSLEPVLQCFVAVSLWAFWKALETRNAWLVLLQGPLLGLAFLAKEQIVIVPATYFLFLVCHSRHRAWLKRPLPYVAMLLAGAMVSHEVYWNYTGRSQSLTFTADQVRQGGWPVSIRPLAFFAGELIQPLVDEELWAGPTHTFPGWYEWPMMHWIEGIVLLGSTLSFFRPRLPEWARLLMTLFMLNAVLTMFAYRQLLFEPFWHPQGCLIPAVVFAGVRFDQALRGRAGRVAVCSLLAYLVVHLCSFLRIDHSDFRPFPLARSLFWYPDRAVEADRMIVIGIEGATWSRLDKLIERGAMPNLEALVARGAKGSIAPLEAAEAGGAGAPARWSVTLAGCLGQGIATWELASSGNRIEPTLWNYYEKLGLRCLVTNVPSTYRPEELFGKMIAGAPAANAVVRDMPAFRARLEPVPGDPSESLRAVLAHGAVSVPIAISKSDGRYSSVSLPDSAERRSYAVDANGWSEWIRLPTGQGPAALRVKLLGDPARPTHVFGTPILLTGLRITYPRTLASRIQAPDAPYVVEGMTWLDEVAEPDDDEWRAAAVEHLRDVAEHRTRVATDLADAEEWSLWIHVFTVGDQVRRRVRRRSGASIGRTESSAKPASSPVSEAYRAIDDELGRIRGMFDDRTWLALVAPSTGAAQLDDFESNDGNSSLDGVFLLVGPGAEPGADVGRLSIVDVAPTLLRAVGLPTYDQITGVCADAAFTPGFRPAPPPLPLFNFDRGQYVRRRLFKVDEAVRRRNSRGDPP